MKKRGEVLFLTEILVVVDPVDRGGKKSRERPEKKGKFFFKKRVPPPYFLALTGTTMSGYIRFFPLFIFYFLGH